MKSSKSELGKGQHDETALRSERFKPQVPARTGVHLKPDGAGGANKDRSHHFGRNARLSLIGVIVLLIALRLVLPYFVKDYVNNQLRKLPDYTGQVSGIDVHLWRGAYKIRDLEIAKTGGAVPVPFFSCPVIDISLQWKELFHGAMVGKILMEQPRLNFVAGPSEKESQSGKNQPWEKTVASFYPFQLNQFEIRQGNVHFQDFYQSQLVDIFLTNVTLVATNLTNTRGYKEKLPSGVQAKGSALGDGEFELGVRLDPLAATPTYELNAKLTNVDLVALNNFMRGYAKVDVERGRFSLFTSVASVDGKYQGFIKVLFQDLKVFAWEKERKKNVLEIFWQAIVGTLSAGFKNHPHDQLATQIPISGTYTNSHVGVFPAVGNLLRNAFIRALVPDIGKPVQLQDVEKSAAAPSENQ